MTVIHPHATQVEPGFVAIPLLDALVYLSEQIIMYGFKEDTVLNLSADKTHFGVVLEGSIELDSRPSWTTWKVTAGEYFSVVGSGRMRSQGRGMMISAFGYQGANIMGGPIEDEGRLRYIDGCTDSILVHPVRKGEPVLNHLHFPAGITQTMHTHPSLRAGIVYRGNGICVLGEDVKVELEPGMLWVIEPGTLHGFNTLDSVMDVIAFHPDSDFGATDDDHPMVNRTIVDGQPANSIEEIRTKRRK